MKDLTKEEKATMLTRPQRKQGIVRTKLMNMKVDDIVLIEPKDWKWRSGGPNHLCRRVEEKTGMEFLCEEVLPSGQGWIITRTK
jgi:hypothetical protein